MVRLEQRADLILRVGDETVHDTTLCMITVLIGSPERFEGLTVLRSRSSVVTPGPAHALQWKVHVSCNEARTGTHRSGAGQSLTGAPIPHTRASSGS